MMIWSLDSFWLSVGLGGFPIFVDFCSASCYLFVNHQFLFGVLPTWIGIGFFHNGHFLLCFFVIFSQILFLSIGSMMLDHYLGPTLAKGKLRILVLLFQTFLLSLLLWKLGVASPIPHVLQTSQIIFVTLSKHLISIWYPCLRRRLLPHNNIVLLRICTLLTAVCFGDLQ